MIFRPIRLIFSTIVFLVAFFVFATGVHAAAITVNCSGAFGSPTAVDEASLASDDVMF